MTEEEKREAYYRDVGAAVPELGRSDIRSKAQEYIRFRNWGFSVYATAINGFVDWLDEQAPLSARTERCPLCKVSIPTTATVQDCAHEGCPHLAAARSTRPFSSFDDGLDGVMALHTYSVQLVYASEDKRNAALKALKPAATASATQERKA